ncbi:MAG TPA: hypothetical protein VLN59_02520 [Burkholderiales bacterium]|nr:hypothetical protein [Burkholderiales bacterium]
MEENFENVGGQFSISPGISRDAHMARKTRKSRKRSIAQSGARDAGLPQRSQRQPAIRTQNKLAQAQNRWQRTVRYVWDKKRG